MFGYGRNPPKPKVVEKQPVVKQAAAEKPKNEPVEPAVDAEDGGGSSMLDAAIATVMGTKFFKVIHIFT